MKTIELLSALLGGEKQHRVTVLSNASAFLSRAVEDVSWVGFYLLDDEGLYLGPFQGKVACERIAIGKGVCGTSAEKRKTLIVPDVHQFPGHIACDSESNSEVVVPLISKDDMLLGVLDVDSRTKGRFSIPSDVEILIESADVIASALERCIA